MMQRIFKDYSGVPNIKTVKLYPEDIMKENVFSYPVRGDARTELGNYGTCDPELDAIELPLGDEPGHVRDWCSSVGYGTCDPRLDAIELPLSDKSDLTEEKGKTLRKVYNPPKM